MKNKNKIAFVAPGEPKAKSKIKGLFAKIVETVYFFLVTVPAIKVIQGKLGFRKSLRDGDFAIKAKAMHDALVNDINAFFSPPFADLVLLSDLIDRFEKAINNVQLKVLGAGALKKQAKTDLYNCLLSAKEYINKLARDNQANAEAIINSALMEALGAHSYKKQLLSVKKGDSTCEALLQCIAVKIDGKYYKATYNFQSSIDGGTTWINLDDTTEAKLVVTGLVLGTVMKFRTRSKSKKLGLTKWCPPVDYTVA